MKNFFNKDLFAKDYRMKAEELVRPMKDKLVVIYLIYLAITYAVTVINGLTGITQVVGDYAYKTTWFQGLVNLFITGPFVFSFIMIAANLYNAKPVDVKDLFSGFKRFTQAFLVNLLSAIYTALWTLLFVVPGIIKTFSYAMAPYIAVDNPELSANECITKSREMMRGNKWKLFCLEISYLGWLILCVLTLGILTLWVAPKMQQAQYLFYLKVSGKGLADIKAQEAALVDQIQESYEF